MRQASLFVFGGFLALFSAFQPFQNRSHAASSTSGLIDTAGKDSVLFAEFKSLPLKAKRKIPLKTTEGTWTSLDISPDGKTIIFDMMGDLFSVPVTGGKAEQITKGLAFDMHPRFSPDGSRILFISDRSGSDNVWYIDKEKKDTVQLTKEINQDFPSADWTPDGEYIVFSKGRLIPQLYMIHKDGGKGIQLTDAQGVKNIDPAVSADGRYIYYSRRNGSWNYNAQLPQYQLGVYDRENAKITTITSRYGSAFTPVFSADSNWLVYGTRYEDKTGLVLQNLKTGDEKWLAYPVQRDDQESIATMGVLPGMAFSPDSKALIASYGGKIHRIPLDGATPSEIPFTVDAELEAGPDVTFNYPVPDSAFGLATQIRDAVPSPDGKKLAFTALDRLYVMDYPAGKPKRVTANEFTEAEPAWSPDGSELVFTTWNAAGGALYKVSFKGKGSVLQLTKSSAFYQMPVYNNLGDKIVFIRNSNEMFKASTGPFANGSGEAICWISANGGEVELIDQARGRYNPHFVKNEKDRIYLNTAGSLVSIRWDGSDEKVIAKITGITTYGFGHFVNGRPAPPQGCVLTESDVEAQEVNMPSPAALITMSPTGVRAFAKIHNEIYTVTIPKAGKTAVIAVSEVNSADFPARKLTDFGGEFPAWQSDGKKVHWSLGNTHWVYDLEKAKAFDDSVRLAKKEADRKKAEKAKEPLTDSLQRGDSTLTKDSTIKLLDSALVKASMTAKKDEKKEEPKFAPEETEVKVYYERDIPKGALLLKGGQVITMKGDEVLENTDILVVNNRIKAIGKSGTLQIPSNAEVINVQGKTIMPGFVDVHAHMWPQWGIHKNDVWMYAANLAYGVTTTRDPQTGTTDILTYADLVDAGKIIGPRVLSTGPGVGFWSYNIKDSAQAESVLQQYSKYYHTNYIKMYVTGNRMQRQWIINAARNQQLMPTTEGALNLKLNMTNLLDGYPGHEHAIPVYPLYGDMLNTIAATKMIVTPTLLVAYGGPWAENYYYEREKPYNDQKLQYFTPYSELAEKTRRRAGWFMDDEHVFVKHAKSMNKLVQANGLAGIGSHGQLQGLGYHWELWSMQSGGMKNHDALKVATIQGAEGLGLQKDLGSIEEGKLADLVILNKNPLHNIRNTNTVRYVVKNGRLYDGHTCDEIYPLKRKYIRKEWMNEKPVNNTGLKE